MPGADPGPTAGYRSPQDLDATECCVPRIVKVRVGIFDTRLGAPLRVRDGARAAWPSFSGHYDGDNCKRDEVRLRKDKKAGRAFDRVDRLERRQELGEHVSKRSHVLYCFSERSQPVSHKGVLQSAPGDQPARFFIPDKISRGANMIWKQIACTGRRGCGTSSGRSQLRTIPSSSLKCLPHPRETGTSRTLTRLRTINA